MISPRVQSETAAAPTSLPVGPLVGVIASVTVFALAQGLTYPLLSIILERQGHSASAIGLSAAATPLGFIVSAPLIPSLARRFGAARTVLVCALAAAVTLALIGITGNIAAWFPLRFLLGFLVNPLYVLSESWVIKLSPSARRGRILGLYAAIISAGFVAGPAIMGMVGSRGAPPFVVGVAAFLICSVTIAAVMRRLPDFHAGGEGAGSVHTFAPLAPRLLAAVLIAAAAEQVLLALLPVYAADLAMSERQSAALLVTLCVGNVLLQVPFGLLAERYGPAPMIATCSIGAGASAALFGLSAGSAAQWPAAFMLGAFNYGIYTMAVVELGRRFAGGMLVAGNAAFAMTWGIGGLLGPPATGLVMAGVGAAGFPLTLTAGLTSLVLLLVARREWPA